MSGWWFCGLLVVGFSVSVVNSRIDLDSPLRLAHCRATCLYKVNMAPTTDTECHTSTLCSQCWETCRLLQTTDEVSTYCSPSHCGQGCLEACRFHFLSPVRKPPVLLTAHEEILDFSDSRVSWQADRGGVHVYVVMGREASKPWSQLSQTVDSSASLPSDVDLETVRVLVVDWRGLTKVFSPRPESSLEQVQKIIRSLGMDKRIVLGHPLNHTHLQPSSLTEQQNTSARNWRLREVSMIHQSALVVTQISWDPQQLCADCLQMYLVTWKVDGGVLRGNLLTNATSVTLSLWPDTLYTIKVSLLSAESEISHSEPLVLDTHHIPQSSSAPTTQSDLVTGPPTGGHQVPHAVTASSKVVLGHHGSKVDTQRQVVAGVAAAALMFLVVSLSLTWRWHHRLSLPHSKLLDLESETPNLFRVFPPAVRLLGQRHDVPPELFSSTDNLLPGSCIPD